MAPRDSLATVVSALFFSSTIPLSACQDRPDTIAIDYKCTEQEVALIAKAIQEWYEATDSVEVYIPYSLHFDSDENPTGFLDPERGDEAFVYKIDTTHPGYPELKKEAGVDMLGYGVENTQIVFVVDNIQGFVDNGIFQDYEEAFYYTALHEYGHFVGLVHLHAPRALMANQMYAGTEACIDTKTLNFYCKNNFCGYNSHPTCKEEDNKSK